MNQQIITNQSTPHPSQLQITEQSSFNFMYITIVVAIVLILGVLKFTKSKGKPRNTIAIVGERFSGKTQLFISLNQGKKMKTVPSIHNNKTTYTLNNKKYEMIDYIGDNISKEQVLQKLNQIYTIIHVIDGTDQKIISDAAMFAYRVLVSKQYQRQSCNYIILLNKNDLSAFIGKAKLEQKLQDEIEHIKQSRINQGEQNQSEDDYIKLSKNRFKIPFKIVQGSAQQNIKDLQMTIESL